MSLCKRNESLKITPLIGKYIYTAISLMWRLLLLELQRKIQNCIHNDVLKLLSFILLEDLSIRYLFQWERYKCRNAFTNLKDIARTIIPHFIYMLFYSTYLSYASSLNSPRQDDMASMVGISGNSFNFLNFL